MCVAMFSVLFMQIWERHPSSSFWYMYLQLKMSQASKDYFTTKAAENVNNACYCICMYAIAVKISYIANISPTLWFYNISNPQDSYFTLVPGKTITTICLHCTCIWTLWGQNYQAVKWCVQCPLVVVNSFLFRTGQLLTDNTSDSIKSTWQFVRLHMCMLTLIFDLDQLCQISLKEKQHCNKTCPEHPSEFAF